MATERILAVLSYAFITCAMVFGDPVGTSFTYQGQLFDSTSGDSLTGTYDFKFKLYDALTGGTQEGSDLDKPDVSVQNGYFTVDLDFGDVFEGDAYWLQVDVNELGTYVPLTPRQEITAAPYSLNADLWDGYQLSDYLNQAVKTTSSPSFASINNTYVNGDIYANYRIGDPYTLDAITTGYRNIAVGKNAGTNITTGFKNILIGFDAGASLTAAGTSPDRGYENIFIGGDTGECTTERWNCAVGHSALANNVSGQDNLALGRAAMYGGGASTNDASGNVVVGGTAGYSIDTCDYGTLIGYQCGFNLTTGSENVAIGSRAFYTATSAANNVCIGRQAGASLTTGSGNVLIGNKAGYYQTSSNVLIIDNQNRGSDEGEQTKSLVYGVFNGTVSNQSLRINAGTIDLNGGNDNDLTVNFLGTANSGVLTWMEDEDQFNFEDEVSVSNDFEVAGDTTLGDDSTDEIQHTGRMILRTVTYATSMNSDVAGSTAEMVFCTTDSKFYGCTSGGSAGSATWAALNP